MEGKTKALLEKKVRLLCEILACFFLMQGFHTVFNRISDIINTDHLFWGVVAYWGSAALIILYIMKIDKKNISYLGLKKLSFSDIKKGLLLGSGLFVAQQIPLLLMGMDYSFLAKEPDWGNLIVMSLYCIFCVGFVEELIFRGFILQKTQEVWNQKVFVIVINGLLFYAFHWPPIRFIFGEFFNITINTLILTMYFYKSKKKSIVPLMIAHGFYDILTEYLLPVFIYYISK